MMEDFKKNQKNMMGYLSQILQFMTLQKKENKHSQRFRIILIQKKQLKKQKTTSTPIINQIMMIQTRQCLSLSRYDQRITATPPQSFNMQTNTMLNQKAKTLSQEMMEDFLRRQEEYEKIYGTNMRNQGKKINSSLATTNKYHYFKDVVIHEKQKYEQFRKSSMNLKTNNKRKQEYEHLTETVRMRSSHKRNLPKVKPKNQGKQIEIGLVVIITIPIIFVLTLVLELHR